MSEPGHSSRRPYEPSATTARSSGLSISANAATQRVVDARRERLAERSAAQGRVGDDRGASFA